MTFRTTWMLSRVLHPQGSSLVVLNSVMENHMTKSSQTLYHSPSSTSFSLYTIHIWDGIWSKTFTCIFAMGCSVMVVHFGQLEFLSILLHSTNSWNLLKLHIAPMNPFLPITNFTKLCNNWWLWGSLKCSKEPPSNLAQCDKFKRMSNYQRIVKVLVVRKTPNWGQPHRLKPCAFGIKCTLLWYLLI